MRLIFINSEERKIEIRECVKSKMLETLQGLVGGYIEIINLPRSIEGWNRNSLVVDEEARLKDGKFGFFIKGFDYPIVGNGVFIGSRGSSFIDTDLTRDYIRTFITFLAIKDEE